MANEKLTAARVPCGSCPYRRDVPSGLWERQEYDKLPDYDGATWAQSTKLFLCHQRDGHLCAGWLACHDPEELLAVRLGISTGIVDPALMIYQTDVPVFASGAEARNHGIRMIKRPGKKAKKMISGLVRLLNERLDCDQ